MSQSVLILLHLITGRILAVYLLQFIPLAWPERRKPLVEQLLCSAVVASVTWLILGAWQSWQVWLGVLLIQFITGMTQHAAEVRLRKQYPALLLAGQTAIIAILWLLAQWLSTSAVFISMTWLSMWGNNYLEILILLAGFIVATQAAGVLTGLLIKPFLDQLRQETEERGLQAGGLYIGLLERGLIYLFIISDALAGVGFLLTAKSIFRFGDLTKGKDRKQTEYVIIGTLTSFLLAIVVAEASKYLLSLLQNGKRASGDRINRQKNCNIPVASPA